MSETGKVIDHKEANGIHLYYIRLNERDTIYRMEDPDWDIGDEVIRTSWGWDLYKRSSLENQGRRTE